MTQQLHNTESIESMTAEIAEYEAELSQLRSNLAELQIPNPLEFGSESPKKLHDVYRKSGLTGANNQREAAALREAIEHGAIVLEGKRDRLKDLEKAEELNRAIDRLSVVRVELESRLTRFNGLADQLETEMFELKELFDQASVDYRRKRLSEGANPNSILELIEFRSAIVPVFGQQGDRFILGMRPVDLFRAEKELQQQRMADSALRRAEVNAAAIVEQELKHEQIKKNRERQAIEIRLQEKRMQIGQAESAIEYTESYKNDATSLKNQLAVFKAEFEAIERELEAAES